MRWPGKLELNDGSAGRGGRLGVEMGLSISSGKTAAILGKVR